MSSDDSSTTRRALRGIWNTARDLTARITNPTPSCPLCLDLARHQRILPSDADSGRSIPNYTKLSAFAASAKPTLDGCPYCVVILLACYLQAYHLVSGDGAVRVHFPVNGGLVINGTGLRRGEMVGLRVYTPVGKIPPWASFGTSRRVASDSGSQESIDRIKEWLSDCILNHAECREAGPSLLPTRLIDVGDPSTRIPPRLVETTPGDTGSYIALSHCWGLNQTYRTLLSNLSIMKISLPGFPTPSMPRTFRDAITLTHTLGLRYIWIDSLCIP